MEAEELVRQHTHNINLAQQERTTVRLNLNEDKPSKLFLGRGKKHRAKTRISKITKNGLTLTGDTAEQHMVDLFSNLLGTSSTIDHNMTVDDFLDDAGEHIPKLSEQQAEELDRDITIEELDNVVRKSLTHLLA